MLLETHVEGHFSTDRAPTPTTATKTTTTSIATTSSSTHTTLCPLCFVQIANASIESHAGRCNGPQNSSPMPVRRAPSLLTSYSPAQLSERQILEVSRVSIFFFFYRRPINSFNFRCCRLHRASLRKRDQVLLRRSSHRTTTTTATTTTQSKILRRKIKMLRRQRHCWRAVVSSRRLQRASCASKVRRCRGRCRQSCPTELQVISCNNLILFEKTLMSCR